MNSFDRRRRATASVSSEGQVSTVVYIHGINNHPDEDALKRIWDDGLFGHPMGERSRMAWWVDRTRYPEPPKGVEDDETLRQQSLASGVRTLGRGDNDPFRSSSAELLINCLARNDAERDWLHQLDRALQPGLAPAGFAATTPSAKGIDDWFWLGSTRLVTRLLLADVYDYFFDEDRRKRMRTIFRNRLTNAGPVVVVAHSQGSMIAYDVLRELDAAACDVRLFVTCGSPLGLKPVRERFQKWTKSRLLPWPPCVRRWVNVARVGDIVCADRSLADEVNATADRRIEDFEVPKTSNAHSIKGYLREHSLRQPVYDTVGSAFRQELSQKLVVASDLVAQVERGEESERFPVLIELADVRVNDDERTDGTALQANSQLERHRELVLGALEDVCEASSTADLRVSHAQRFVSAHLTRREIETLRIRAGARLPLRRIWRNASKRALVAQNLDTIQARSAQRAYAADGAGIGVAVLDTGIDGSHPHFARHQNVARQFDCTIKVPAGTGGSGRRGTRDRRIDARQPFDPVEIPASVNSDANGHGTHVAAIIAGELLAANPKQGGREERPLAGVAPKATLFSYKVLGDDGHGEDLYIIRALDHIARINQGAGRPVIHIVNLSLGGGFDPTVFGCGHTPLCNELRRLWQQGVVVVIAAGNEGSQWLATADGYATQANLDLTIGDPANLEEAIAVGSVHRDRPHTYGVSHFSSRGPTADGRTKPDVVAPGEKILAARAGARSGKAVPSIDALYVEMSGTSMAAPHVSGAIAGFLSIRREFIGYPDRVKQLLMQHCTDLGRDRYFQGAGLINLTRMLAGS